MIYPTKNLIKDVIPALAAPWRVFLLCVLLLSSTILFFQFHQPLASVIPETTLNKIILPDAANSPVPTHIPMKPVATLAITPSIWPARGTVSSGFGWRISPFNNGNEWHAGIDIAYAMGAPIVATADGEVVVSGPADGYGNLVQIDHGNGITTLYGHNSQLVVPIGQQVKKGQIIAYAGSTGISTGPHVHYEVRINNTPVDPMKYLVL